MAKVSKNLMFPIKKEIFISPGSDIVSGSSRASEGVKQL
jgi:hypothetical protein